MRSSVKVRAMRIDSGAGDLRDQRLGVLDGWRAASILLVLACHMLPLGPKSWRLNECAGPMGMSLFFTLSGFLICATLLRNPSVPSFLIRRLARILPLAWLAAAFYLVLQGKGYDHFFHHIMFTLNYNFDHRTPLTSPFWSLCVEVHFYAAAAILVGLFGPRGLLLLPILGIAITIYRVYTNTYVGIKTHLRADEIAAGSLILLAWSDRLGRLGRGLRSLVRSTPTPAVAVAFAVACHPSGGAAQYLRPYLGAALVGSALFSQEGRLRSLLTSRPMRYIAEISYALYITHSLTRFGWLSSGDTLERYAKRPLCFAITFVLAHISTFYFEKYFILIGKNLSSRWDRHSPAAHAAQATSSPDVTVHQP
jgi:peptidoglycan/LPS O-acetylase OafA/YrhL